MVQLSLWTKLSQIFETPRNLFQYNADARCVYSLIKQYLQKGQKQMFFSPPQNEIIKGETIFYNFIL